MPLHRDLIKSTLQLCTSVVSLFLGDPHIRDCYPLLSLLSELLYQLDALGSDRSKGSAAQAETREEGFTEPFDLLR